MDRDVLMRGILALSKVYFNDLSIELVVLPNTLDAKLMTDKKGLLTMRLVVVLSLWERAAIEKFTLAPK
jgi:hypothetical protein